MKRFIVTLTMIMIVFGALHLIDVGKCYAQPLLMWQENGTPIRQDSIVEWEGCTAQMGDDNVLAVWTDTRTGLRAVMAQLYNKQGTLWEEDLFIGEQEYWGGEDNDSRSLHTNRGIHFDPSYGKPVVVKSSDGCVIVAWIKTKYTFYNNEFPVAINKISEAGELLWSDGFVIPNTNAKLLDIVPDNEGGVYIVWLEHRPQRIYGLHLNASGEPYSEEWDSETGLQLFGSSCGHFSLSPDRENGFLMTVADISGSMKDSFIIKRISPSGETLWDKEIKENDDISIRRAIVVKANEDCFGVYYNPGWASVGALLLIDIDGELVWQDTLYLSRNNQIYAVDLQYTDEPEPCFIATWLESDNQNKHGIYSQKIDLSGKKLWGEEAVEITEVKSLIFYFGCQLDKRKDDVRVVISWYDGSTCVFMQQIDTNGNLLLGKEGIQVTDMKETNEHCSLNIVNNDLYVTWNTRRYWKRNDPNGLFYQVYDENFQPFFTDNGKLIYQGSSGTARNSLAIKNGDYVYIVWVDTRFGKENGQIMIQKIDSDGNIQFKKNGIPITPIEGSLDQASINAVEHHSGGIAITWKEGYDIYVQAIGPNGERLWDPNNDGKGIRVSTDENCTKYSPKISKQGESYSVAWVWQTISPPHCGIRMQKIVDGSIIWDKEVIRTEWEFKSEIYLKRFINQEYLLWAVGNTYGQLTEQQLYLKRINEDGNVEEGWDEDGLLVYSNQGNMLINPRVLTTKKGIVMVWDDHRHDEGDIKNTSIYCQLVSPDGCIQWEENGILIANYPNSQSNVATLYDDEHIYLAWQDSRNNYSRPDIAIQKIDLDGNLLWSEQAKIITQSGLGNRDPVIAKLKDSVLVIWRKDFNPYGNELRMQLVSASTGQSAWNEDGIFITPFADYAQKIVVLNDNEAVVVWEDRRTDDMYLQTNIYAQKVNLSSGVSVDEDIAAPQEAMSLYANYPNPFNPDTKISFNLSQNENVSLKVFNIKGQLVKTLLDEEYLENGKHIIVWDGKDNDGETASSGIYFYRLEGDKESHTKKMALIK